MALSNRWKTTTCQPTKRLDKNDKDYGTPVAGSKTEARGKLAHERVSKEILELCYVIQENGTNICRKKQCCKKNKSCCKKFKQEYKLAIPEIKWCIVSKS